jgi:PPOX class probable F420-dependent enzyme
VPRQDDPTGVAEEGSIGSPLTDNLRTLLDSTDVGVLGVRRADGRPHLSHVRHLRDGDRLLFSTEPTRVKAKAVARDGWAVYSVRGPEPPYPGFTVEGPAQVLREGIGGPTRRLFELIFGKAMDPMTDDQVLAMNRVIIELTPTNVYAVTHLQA